MLRLHKSLLFFFSILFFACLIRLIPGLGNHFYFTIDQGRDAVTVRDILHGHFTLLGPQTSVEHIFHGGLWYYMLVPFYLISGGSPFGGVLLMILISITTLALSFRIGKSFAAGFPTLLLLTIFIPFYETSRYSFNPFFLPLCAMVLVLGLSKVKKNKSLMLYIAACAVGLTFHADLMVFVPFAVFFSVVSSFFLFKKKTTFEDIFLSYVIVFLFVIPHLISEFLTGFSQWKALLHFLGSDDSTFHVTFGEQVLFVGKTFLTLIGEVVFPFIPWLGSAGFFGICVALFIKFKKFHTFSWLSFALVFLSFVWFCTNSSMRPWHLVFVGTILLMSLIFELSRLPRTLFFAAVTVLFLIQSSFATITIASYISDQNDEGLLSNQLKTIDWIYGQAGEKGFRVYTYVPSVRDYHYQYLIYWRGLNKFGYLPCEYTTTPGISASGYIPHVKEYQSPQKPCTDQFFLVMEPAVTQSLQDSWHEQVSQDSTLLSTQRIGEVIIEHRQKN